MIKKIINRLFRKKPYKISYSQNGEDLILDFILSAELKLNRISYLDIGTNDPIEINNTYLFYTRGNHGVCVEPNPLMYEKIKNVRKNDVCLNIGICGNDVFEGDADFFIMSAHTLNTFSKEVAENTEKIEAYGAQKVEKKIKIPLVRINKLLEDNFVQSPTLVSIDVEGWELSILKTLDFNRWRPAVFCIETVFFDKNAYPRKNQDILSFMEGQNYFLFADTFINSIFVDQNIWDGIHDMVRNDTNINNGD